MTNKLCPRVYPKLSPSLETEYSRRPSGCRGIFPKADENWLKQY